MSPEKKIKTGKANAIGGSFVAPKKIKIEMSAKINVCFLYKLARLLPVSLLFFCVFSEYCPLGIKVYGSGFDNRVQTNLFDKLYANNIPEKRRAGRRVDGHFWLACGVRHRFPLKNG